MVCSLECSASGSFTFQSFGATLDSDGLMSLGAHGMSSANFNIASVFKGITPLMYCETVLCATQPARSAASSWERRLFVFGLRARESQSLFRLAAHCISSLVSSRLFFMVPSYTQC